MNRKLSYAENVVHFSGWFLACVVSLVKLFHAQTDILENSTNIHHTLRDLNPGWRILSRLKDDSDPEWNTLKYFLRTSWFYLLLQFCVSEIIRRTNISVLKYWYLISSVIFIVNYLGVRQLALIITQPIVFWVVIFAGGKSISVWLTSILFLTGYNSLKYKYYFWHFLDSEYITDEEVFLLLFAVAWVNLRCISFCIDYVESKEKLNSSQDENNVRLSVAEHTVNMFSYVLYLPVLLVGPIILYEEYDKSFHVKNESLSLRLKRFMWDMILYAMYSVILEIAFHYIYFLAMQSNIEAVKLLPSVALCGGGLWMGLQFHVKYVISYGTTTAFARLDNIDAPPTPRCIARIHLYSQMWRYFDVGLYRFLFKYIYKPISDILKCYLTSSYMTCKLLSSLVTFIFIFVWHGTTWSILVWSVLNYLGIVLEYFGKNIGKSEKYLWFRQKVLRTDAIESRFIAMLCVPMLGLSAVSNFYLFADSDIGDMYFGLMKWPSLVNFAIVYISLYCSCHVAIALQDFPSRTDVKMYNKTA
ncbi:protein-cysteine N-palmitoyltransferase Rasp [Anticarsia gemmatalis]|uniref:protein-cysteine N-palmitoyltransferase Rasp n=1 Tax=Anticarsia gemmatalis TaxID=129554 RepID=UPI003F762C4C